MIHTDYFVIECKLPSLNEVINKNRQNKYAGAALKKDIEEAIGYYIQKAINEGTLHQQVKPCWIIIEWTEKTKRRDADNIQSSQKFILDALVKNGILENDNRNHVVNVVHIITEGELDCAKVSFAKSVDFLIDYGEEPAAEEVAIEEPDLDEASTEESDSEQPEVNDTCTSILS